MVCLQLAVRTAHADPLLCFAQDKVDRYNTIMYLTPLMTGRLQRRRRLLAHILNNGSVNL